MLGKTSFFTCHLVVSLVCDIIRPFRFKSKYEKVGVLPIWIVKSNVSSVGPSSERNRNARKR